MDLYQTATDATGKIVDEKTDSYDISINKLCTALRKKTEWLDNRHLIDLKRHGTIIVQRGQFKVRLEIRNAGQHEFTGRVIDYTAPSDDIAEGG